MKTLFTPWHWVLVNFPVLIELFIDPGNLMQLHPRRAGHRGGLTPARARQSSKRTVYTGRAGRASGSFMCYELGVTERKIYGQLL